MKFIRIILEILIIDHLLLDYNARLALYHYIRENTQLAFFCLYMYFICDSLINYVYIYTITNIISDNVIS